MYQVAVAKILGSAGVVMSLGRELIENAEAWGQ